MGANGKEQILQPGIHILPMEYFVAKDYWTGWILADSTTYSIHHYDGNGTTKFQQERDQLKYQYYKKLSYFSQIR